MLRNIQNAPVFEGIDATLFEHSSSRRLGAAIINIEPLYAEWANFIGHAVRQGLNLPLLEAVLVEQSLQEDNGDESLLRALTHAWNGGMSPPPYVRTQAVEFARDLFDEICMAWNYPPFNDPDLVIYSATRHGYHGRGLLIRIEYRIPLRG